MTDSVQVFIPGYRLTDSSTGAPLQGALLSFFDAGTTNPKAVYSDNGLLTSLGSVITCDALGRPTSDGTSPTNIYVGTADYKIIVATSGAAVVETKDNIKGAVVSSGASVAAIATRPVATKSLNYAVVSADQSTVFAGNCTAGRITFTLPSAVTVGNGWLMTVQHAGTANQCVVATVSAQTISDGSKNFNGFYSLTFNGEEATFVSDGGNWRVASHTNPFLKGTFGIIPIVSRLATSPATPTQGDWYIVTAAAGAWSTFTIGDVALYTGGNAAAVTGWVNFTPPTNIGWIAWVQNEGVRYQFVGGSWRVEGATTTLLGTVVLADTAAVKARTLTRTVPADLQHLNYTHPKAWLSYNGVTPTLNGSYGVSSVVKSSTGVYTVTLSITMASATYCVVTTAYATGGLLVAGITNMTATTFQIVVGTPAFNFIDGSIISACVLGDI